MSATGPFSTFTDRLERNSVTWEVVAMEGLSDALEAEMVGETVGTEIPFAPAGSYPEAVTTDPTVEQFTGADTGITPGAFAVADYGSVVVTPTANWEGPVSLYPPKHVAVLRRGDVLPDLTAAFERLGERFDAGDDDAVFVTGPSSTGDMGASITGVHGPSEMHVVVVEP